MRDNRFLPRSPDPQDDHPSAGGRRTGRGFRATILSLGVAFVLSACGGTTAADDKTASRPVPVVAIPANVSQALPSVDPTPIQVSEGLHGAPARVLAAGHAAPVAESGSSSVATRRNGATVATVLDEENRSLGSAIVVAFESLEEKSKPTTVDYRSTAFTRLVTMPPFVTSHPVELAFLRGAAEVSPYLEDLANAIETHAAKDVNFDANPSEAEVEALAALVVDVRKRLSALASPLTTPAGDAGRVAPVWALGADRAWEGCLPAMGAAMDDVCIRAESAAAKTLTATVSNRTGGWIALFDQAKGARLLGVVPPETVSLPSLRVLIRSLLKALGRSMVAQPVKAVGGIVGLACKGVALLGKKKCPPKPRKLKDLEQSSDPVQVLASIAEDLEVRQGGDAEIALNQASQRKPVLVTGVSLMGAARDDATLSRYDSHVRGLLHLLTFRDQLYNPLMELVTGVRHKKEERAKTGKSPAPPRSTDTKDADAALREEMSGAGLQVVSEALKTSDRVQESLNAFMRLKHTGELTAFMGAVGALSIDVLSEPDLLSALVFGDSDAATEYLENVFVEVISDYGTSLIPGVGQLKAMLKVSEIAVSGLNAAFGLWHLHAAYIHKQRQTLFEAPNPSIRDFDFGNTEWLDVHGPERVTLTEGTGGGDPILDSRFDQADVNGRPSLFFDADGDGDEDALVPLSFRSGNGYTTTWYFWVWDSDKRRPRQLREPIAEESRCGDIITSMRLEGSAVRIEERRREPHGLEACADLPPLVAKRVVRLAGDKPVLMNGPGGFGGVCPLSEPGPAFSIDDGSYNEVYGFGDGRPIVPYTTPNNEGAPITDEQIRMFGIVENPPEWLYEAGWTLVALLPEGGGPDSHFADLGDVRPCAWVRTPSPPMFAERS